MKNYIQIGSEYLKIIFLAEAGVILFISQLHQIGVLAVDDV